MVIHKSEKEKNTETLLLTENYSLVTGGGDTADHPNKDEAAWCREP